MQPFPTAFWKSSLEPLEQDSCFSIENTFLIGEDTDGNSEYFLGEIDEVQIWSKSLSQIEIIERMGKTLDSSDSLWQHLKAYTSRGKHLLPYPRYRASK